MTVKKLARNNFGRYLLAAAVLTMSACSPGKIPADAAGDGNGAFALSPTGVQLHWNSLNTADYYNIFDLSRGNTPISRTTFNQGEVKGLTKNVDYTLSVRGVRGTGSYLSDALNTWNFRTWIDFSDVNFGTSVNPDGSTTITYSYLPYVGGMPAAGDAMFGSVLSCSLLPVDAGTDPTKVDPFVATNGKTPIVRTTSLFAQTFTLNLGDIDAGVTYAVQCRADYVDSTSSLSAHKFLISPTHQVIACPTKALVDRAYTCTPNVAAANSAPTQTPLSTYEVDSTASTCAWAASARSTGSPVDNIITGTPTAAHIGTCDIVYKYTITSPLGYTSPPVRTTVTISAPDPYTLFPSFAVRALSGAIGYTHLYNEANGATATTPRARIEGDVISDFGYGSSFFVGNDPSQAGNASFTQFPQVTSAGSSTSAPVVPSNFFYGFPVSTSTSNTGYSLDATRPQVNSVAAPGTDGFIRGNMVVPNATITDTVFLAKTNHNSSISLFDFLSNGYTYNGGSSFRPALAQFLSTTVGYDGAGSNWDGALLERPSVRIQSPTVAAIKSYLPASGNPGQSVDFTNADPTKAKPVGLVTTGTGTSFVTNCQSNPGATSNDYSNPAECTPSIPRTIACYGDIIIQRPVLLVDAVFLTDSGGCRVYVTGPVFIQGTITAQTASLANAPLQISSAKSIVVGYSLLSLGVLSGGTRHSSQGLLATSGASGSNNPFLTRAGDAAGSATVLVNDIAAAASAVGLKATDVSSNYALTNNASGVIRHVAFHAPFVFSNYVGQFQGSLIAEVALFRRLAFKADTEMFANVPMFPLYKDAPSGNNIPLKVAAPIQ